MGPTLMVHCLTSPQLPHLAPSSPLARVTAPAGPLYQIDQIAAQSIPYTSMSLVADSEHINKTSC
jgi:hypothetical protein